MDKALHAVRLMRNRRSTILQRALYGLAGESTPVGYKKLTTPQERATWQQHLSRQALAESEGRTQGTAATDMLPEVPPEGVP